MRIGVVVEGESELRSLPLLIAKLDYSALVLGPLIARFSPDAPPLRSVKAIMPAAKILRARGADRLVVLVDREGRNECPSDVAESLAESLAEPCRLTGLNSALVVVKDRMYENWLVADTAAISTIRKRFNFSNGVLTRITKGSDALDALAVLKAAALRDAYDKVADSMRIMRNATPDGIAAHSRSFRRFLRTLDDPKYRDQSRRAL